MPLNDGLYRLKNCGGAGLYLKKTSMNQPLVVAAQAESTMWAICDVSPPGAQAKFYVIEEYAGEVHCALRCQLSTGMVVLDNSIPRLTSDNTYSWSIDSDPGGLLMIRALGTDGDQHWLFAGAVNNDVATIGSLPPDLNAYRQWIAEPVD